MSYSSFEELIKIVPKLNPPKQKLNDYWAHTTTGKEELGKHNEPLQDHIDLVNNTAIKLIEVQNLEPLIEGLIYNLCNQIKFSDKDLVKNFLKEVFISTIAFHDYGKINENFQVDKMQNFSFSPKKSSIGSQHSILSAYLFLNYYLKAFSKLPELKGYQNEIAGIICAFSDSILRHHSSVIDIKEIENPDLSLELESYLYFIGLESPFKYIDQILESKIDFQEGIYLDKNSKDFPLFTLIKLNFSLLTAADYLATLSYHNDISLPDSNDKKWWGILSDERKHELYDKFIDSAPYNRQALSEPENLTKNPNEDYNKRSQKNMNTLRSVILGEVIQNLREHHQEKLFYLKAPTGAGKTNISLAASIELLSKNKTLNKVFYVFPFTTLITQTYKSIIETLGLRSDELVQLHSKAEWNKRNQEENSDGLYEADWENHIENLFVHYPFTLLSHIKFFDVLKGNRKESNYLLHRFSNSIVIIDELQSYSPKFWDHINYFITHYAEAFNMRFILMSATLPEIGKLALYPNQKWIDLISNPQKYFQNENFSGRVDFDFSLMDINDINLNFLLEFIADKGNQYAVENSDSVKIIVEFIKKQTASNFYKETVENIKFSDYTILILSGTILNPRREEIVNNLQSVEWLNKNPKVLIISTQVVEAGVNIDMDIGFKDTSLIDSDEQLAGRVNRNAKKNKNKVYLFNLDKEDNIYRGDERIVFQRAEINLNEHKRILERKEFDLLYNRIIAKHLKNRNELIQKFPTYLKHLQSLRFKSVHEEFQLIEDSSGSVFIPLELPITAFSKNEIKFLYDISVISSSDEKIILGSRIFDMYENIILNRTNNFIVDRDSIQKFQSLLSKYTISLYQTQIQLIEFVEKNKLANIKPYRFGYLYFSEYAKYYDYKVGLSLPSEQDLEQKFAYCF